MFQGFFALSAFDQVHAALTQQLFRDTFYLRGQGLPLTGYGKWGERSKLSTDIENTEVGFDFANHRTVRSLY